MHKRSALDKIKASGKAVPKQEKKDILSLLIEMNNCQKKLNKGKGSKWIEEDISTISNKY